MDHVLLLRGCMLTLLCGAVGAQTAPYVLLDNVEGDFVNHNPAPIRPMLLAPDNINLFACNVYGDRVVRIDGSFTVVQEFRTLRGPVAIAHYEPTKDEQHLLVACHLSDCVAVHDRATGRMLFRINTRPGPADLLVVPDKQRLFVSCPDDDVVLEIDLTAPQNAPVVYPIPSKSPTFLALHQGEVLVAPRWSGNGSVVHRQANEFNPQAGPQGILDTHNPNVASVGLPDNDLFWLDRTAGVAKPVAQRCGSLLFTHAENTLTGEHWMLNTDANNKIPNRQTEGAIAGDISRNRLTRLVLPQLTGIPTPVIPAASQIRDLDQASNPSPGPPYNPTLTQGIPYSVFISPITGFALITGLLSDNVTLYDPQGNWVLEWDLPTGCMPRQVLADQTETFFAIYGGDGNVYVFLLAFPLPIPVNTISVGFDPTPAPIKAGRKVFFDGSHSQFNNASCATCHDEGKHDMLAWNLSNISNLVTPPNGKDNKGPMVTQTLFAINRMVPFHWRGEQLRGLADFNAAFVNLLGAALPLSTAPGGDFEKFEAFVLSLENRANPRQDRNRVLNDNIQPPMVLGGGFASATLGQTVFTGNSPNAGFCTVCHHLPTATSNDMVPDGLVFGEALCERMRTKIAGFHQLPYKGFLPEFTVTWNPAAGLGTNQLYPILGTGLAHSGNPRHILHFARFFFDNPSNPIGMSQVNTNGVTAYMDQFDSGTAPRVHDGVLLDMANFAAAQGPLASLMTAANAANVHCDVGVFGVTTIGAGPRLAGWVLVDRVNQNFLRDDGVLQNLSFFQTQAQTTGDFFVFSGLPVGMARGWAIDSDRDDLLEALEPSPAAAFNPDTDNDTFLDGHEVANGGNPTNAQVVPNDITPPVITNAVMQWNTSKVTRVRFDTSELCTALVACFPANSALPLALTTTSTPRRHHSVIVKDLIPGQAYPFIVILVLDLARPSPLLGWTLLSGPNAPGSGDLCTVASQLGWAPTSPVILPTGEYTFTANMQLSAKPGSGFSNPNNWFAVGMVLVNGVPASQAQLPANLNGPQAFTVNQVPYTVLPFPFAISTAAAIGAQKTFTFTVAGLNSGDLVELVLKGAGEMFPGSTMTAPDMRFPNNPPPPFTLGPPVPGDFSLVDTPAQFRSVGYRIP